MVLGALGIYMFVKFQKPPHCTKFQVSGHALICFLCVFLEAGGGIAMESRCQNLDASCKTESAASQLLMHTYIAEMFGWKTNRMQFSKILQNFPEESAKICLAFIWDVSTITYYYVFFSLGGGGVVPFSWQVTLNRARRFKCLTSERVTFYVPGPTDRGGLVSGASLVNVSAAWVRRTPEDALLCLRKFLVISHVFFCWSFIPLAFLKGLLRNYLLFVLGFFWARPRIWMYVLWTRSHEVSWPSKPTKPAYAALSGANLVFFSTWLQHSLDLPEMHNAGMHACFA